MKPRLNLFSASPAVMQPWIELGQSIHNDGLEPLLKHLVTMRVSQINGCAFCLHFHLADARKHGDILQTTALEIEDGRVVNVYITRNPDKLRHVAGTLH